MAQIPNLWELAEAIERVDVGAGGALKTRETVIVQPDLLYCCQSWFSHVPIISARPHTCLLRISSGCLGTYPHD